jgi:Fe-S cluster biosynthesis and repair protein YggX
MEIENRIAQWEKMTLSDPENDMGWFSLGNAYRDGNRPEDAARAYDRAIAVNPGLSRAYQLRGQVLIQLGRNEEAGALLTTGYVKAAERGDVMPQRAMGSLLEKLGLPLPEVKNAKPEEAVPEDGSAIRCKKTGLLGTRLPDPPMRGAIGRFIYDNYSAQTWRAWIAQGTKVINEMRLDFSNDSHQKVYDTQMMEWLGFTMDDVEVHERNKAAEAKP